MAIAIRGKASWAVYFPLLLFGLANAGIAAYRLASL
jgi:hypothetical protein